MKKIKKVMIGAVAVAASVFSAPLAHAAGPGDLCYNWHATTTDSNGNTLVCTHTPDSGHLMYWEGQVMDR
jgi:hypothetical protein